jgi:Transglutaminase-like superfamily/TgpA N-terminal domain
LAHATGTPVRTQRLITLAATVALALATGFALGRVFLGAVSSYKLMFVALLSALVACALERRNLLAATLVSAVALVIVTGWFVAAHTLRLGLPTPSTIRAIVDQAQQVGNQARIQVAPAPPVPALMLAAVTATWAAVFSAHALAFRAGSPLLALLPPIALVAFADTVLDQVIKPIYGVVFLGAALVVIFADGLRRLQGWGPVWTGPGRDARLSRTAGRGARRVGFAALGLALIAPALIPGFGSKAIVSLGGNGNGSVRIDPLVNVAYSLQQGPDLNLFTVQTPTPTYYRWQVLPNFDGVSGFSPDVNPPTTSVVGNPSLNPDIDSGAMAHVTAVTQEFHFLNQFDSAWMPFAYPADYFPASSETIAWDSTNGVADIGGPIEAGTDYSVQSLLMHPTAADLKALPLAVAPKRYTYTGHVDGAIRTLAQQWTEGDTNTYDKVMDIENNLKTKYVYDTTVKRRTDESALVDFLFNDKRGFCEQFAAAMAIMLRTLGIPSRLAVGFDSGNRSPGGNASDTTWTVSAHDAHTWPEVLFPTYGWLQFEPTPAITPPSGETYLYEATAPPKAVCPPGKPKCDLGNHFGNGGKNQGARAHNDKHENITALERNGGSDPALTAPATPALAWYDGRKLLAVALVVALLFLLLVPPLRGLRRRRRLRRAANEPRRLILTTYDVFTERAGEMGFPRGPGETIEEYRRRVTGTGLLRNGDLDRLSDLTTAAAYGEREPGIAEAQDAGQAAGQTLTDLRRATPFARRLRGRYMRQG